MLQSASQAGMLPPPYTPAFMTFSPAALARYEPGTSLPFHPAFLHPLYSAAGMSPRGAAAAAMHHTDKRKAFTIDAILADSKGPQGDRKECPGEGLDRSLSLDLSQLQRHPHPRLPAGHPYLNPLSCHTAYGFRPPGHGNANKVADKLDKKRSSSGSPEWKQGKSKRVRTIFTPEQLERLEAEFERQQYMVGTERYYLAASLNLTEAQVKVWFQNRRIKWRKQNLEQQHARLAKLDLLKGPEDTPPASDSEQEPEEDKFGDPENEADIEPA